MAEKIRHTGIRKEKGEAQKALESAFSTSFKVLQFIMYIVIVLLLFSGVFMVDQSEKAVVLRFGKVKEVYGPGFHFALPYPIDEVRKIKVDEAKSIELDKVFWHQETEGSSRALPLHPSVEYGYSLTSDANIIHSKWVVLYRINDPVKYLLEISNPETILYRCLENAVIEASAQYTVDETTRYAKENYRKTVERVFKQNLKRNKLDETYIIQNIELNNPKPPVQTQEAFNAVINAEQERDAKLSQARGDASSILNTAGGAIARDLVKAIDQYRAAVDEGTTERTKETKESVDELLAKAGGSASQIISIAQAYKKLVATEAESDAKRILELREQFARSPGILAYEKLFALYMELFEDRILYVLTETTADGGREMRILINPDPDVKREERQQKFLEK